MEQQCDLNRVRFSIINAVQSHPSDFCLNKKEDVIEKNASTAMMRVR